MGSTDAPRSVEEAAIRRTRRNWSLVGLAQESPMATGRIAEPARVGCAIMMRLPNVPVPAEVKSR